MKKLMGIIAIVSILTACTPTFPLVMDTRPPTPTMAPTVAPTAAPTQICDIKGNINRQGDHIYFTPASINYRNVHAEKMFCSEDEAKAAGYRKAGK